ncbi:MAG: hypothetical protein U5L08_01485 [Xanthomonadales bacterium]|nr:hypothetical protein [Xanthomonadales bacterium]
MNESTPRLRPQAVADYLWYRFQIRPGHALCLALEQPQTRDNHEALIAWSSEAIERYRITGPEDLVNLIEGDLFEQMFDAGLVGGMVETPPAPPSISARLFGPADNCRSESTRAAAEHAADPNHTNNVIEFAGRTRHD